MAFQQNHKEAGTTVSGYASSLTPKQPLRSGRPSTTLSWNKLGAKAVQRWHTFQNGVKMQQIG